MPKITKNCIVCGISFSCYEGGSHIRKYCSMRCRNSDPEFKRKISTGMKKRWEDPKYREHQIPMIVAALQGERNPMYGKTHSASAREKISVGNAEKWKDPEYKVRMSEIIKNRKTRIFETKTSKINIGEKSKRSLSEEHRKKISNTRCRLAKDCKTWKTKIYKDGELLNGKDFWYKDLVDVEIECSVCGRRTKTHKLRRSRHIIKSHVCWHCGNAGKKAWNSGLSKETDDRVKCISDKILKTMGSQETKDKLRKIHTETGYWFRKDRDDYDLYARLVDSFTRLSDTKSLDNHDKVGHCTKPGSYSLDHKFSVCEGFKRGILPCIIGSIVNLQYITCSENSSKNRKCSITQEELYAQYIASQK